MPGGGFLHGSCVVVEARDGHEFLVVGFFFLLALMNIIFLEISLHRDGDSVIICSNRCPGLETI